MSQLNIFCISLNSNHLNLIKKIGYIPVGLGNDQFNENWTQDKKGENICDKNPYYGEYTFHYWLWKNNKIDLKSWIGFCQYRKFWGKLGVEKNNFEKSKIRDFNEFNSLILKEIPEKYQNTETILTENFYVNQFRFSKFLKHNFKKMLRNPELIFNKNKRTIKFHFDMWHGEGNLDKAIKKLPLKERNDFEYFVNTEVSFNSQNMFICRNKNILFSYYESVFPWLYECEKIFGLKNTKNYGLKRIYGFLAERYCSYWFKKYTKFNTLPYLFKDLSDFL